jgi:hypothetical protein
MAARAAQLALMVFQFVTAPRTPAPRLGDGFERTFHHLISLGGRRISFVVHAPTLLAAAVQQNSKQLCVFVPLREDSGADEKFRLVPTRAPHA